MIIHPAGKRRAVVRPAVLVSEGRCRALDDGRLYDIERVPQGLRVYCSWDDADAYARAGVGELVSWGEEPIRWRAVRRGDARARNSDAVIVKVACHTRREFDAGLAAWCEWLHGEGVNPGWSLGGTSMNLLRSTLEAELPTTLGELPPPRWTLGGRQQCFVEPGTVVHGAVQLDLPAAYTHVIGGMRYGGAWRKVEPSAVDQWAAARFPVLCRAAVRAVDVPVGPLHHRPARRPDTRVEEIAPSVPYPWAEGGWWRWEDKRAKRLTGLWTYNELRQAWTAGVSIKIENAWVHCGGDTVFADWHDAIMEGRALPGFGGQLAKATGNALWGQFVIDDRKRLTVQRWNGAYVALPVQATHGHQVRAWDVGELVTGTVRAKLYEALSRFSGSLVCCHTDGLWVRDDTDQGIGEPWRLKSDAAELHVLDQQKYRYRTRRARTFQTVFSGVPSARADEVFQRLWAQHA